MGMVVRTNTMANNAFRQLGMNNNQVSKSLEKLASGYRINRAGDDAAGLAVSESMKAQITGLEAASSNSQDAISLVQTAEGALTEVHDMLNRMVELSTKAANGTYTDAQRQNYQDEITQLQEEIDRISKTTEFNGQKLLDGKLGSTSTGLPIAVTDLAGTVNGAALAAGTDVAATKTVVGITGAGVDFGSVSGDIASITVSYRDENGDNKTITVEYQVTGNSGTTANNALNALQSNKDFNAAFDVAAKGTTGLTFTAKTSGAAPTINSVTVNTSKSSSTAKLETTTEGKDATKSFAIGSTFKEGDSLTIDGRTYTYVKDANGSDGKSFSDIASLVIAADANGVKLDVDNTGAVTATKDGNSGNGGLSFQVGATADADNVLSLNVADMSAVALGVADVDVSKVSSAQAAIDKINSAIDTVSKTRSGLGAMQNRLEHTINNLDTTAENLSAANSRIRDTDMAKEMMQYTQMNVLVQSAQAMLAQANQQPQSVLQLLQ